MHDPDVLDHAEGACGATDAVRPAAARLRRFAAAITVAGLLAAVGLAEAQGLVHGEHPCFHGDDQTTAGVRECLDREHKVVHRLLKQKIDNLIRSVERDTTRSADLRKDVVATIRKAHGAWNTLVDAECRLAVAHLYRGGSGEYGAYLECQVLRTMERIKVVGSDDAYRFYGEWGR